MLKALLASSVFHVAVGLGLLSSAWWWWQDSAPRREPPTLAVSLPDTPPPVTEDSVEIPVVPPNEPEPEVIPVVDVEATALEPLEDLPPAEDYRAVRPWMPRGQRYRPTAPPPNRVKETEVAATEPPPLVVSPQPAPPPSEPQASVLLAPQIDAEQCPAPEYPRRARRLRLEGTTQLLVTVSAEGEPMKVLVQTSSGHALLDDAAVKAVYRWHFHPAKRDGVVEQGDLLVPIRFDIVD
ncbi:MAG: energy transducer TonB [Planctomycetota bacterium]|jgi:protein TonB